MLTDQVVYVFGVVPACCSEVILVRRSRMPQLLPAYSKLVADGGFRDFQQIMVPVRRIFSVIVCPIFFSICVLFIFQLPPPSYRRENFELSKTDLCQGCWTSLRRSRCDPQPGAPGKPLSVIWMLGRSLTPRLKCRHWGCRPDIIQPSVFPERT